ncbi:MAG: response regulator [Brevinematales bacterium]
MKQNKIVSIISAIFLCILLSILLCHLLLQSHESWVFIAVRLLVVIAFFLMIQYPNKAIKQAGDELRKTRNYLKNIIDSMPSMLISINQQGFITQWNSTAERETGISSREALNRKLLDLIPAFTKYRGNFEKVVETCLPMEIKRESISEEELRYFNISFYPLVFNGACDVVIRLDDITELEKKEFQLRQAQKMETVGTLAGGLAHDFNNILAGIIGSVSLLRYMQETPDGIGKNTLKEHIEIIEDSAKKASEMVNRLLSLARKHDMVISDVDLNVFVKNIVRICTNTFDNSVEIRISAPDEPAFVKADPSQVEQVLLNLCINAEHAMTIMRKEHERQGGIMLISLAKMTFDSTMIGYHPEANVGDYWMVSVEDTGVGISKETMHKIFDPFFTTKGKGRGTGLGLAMVYNIVHQLNGFIEISSREGAGSEFRIYLPVYLPVNESLVQPDGDQYPHKIEEPPRGNETILLADDDENVRLIAGSMLEKCGYSVIMADDGKDCVETYKKNNEKVSLVILDISMPRLTGKDAFIEMKNLSPGLKVLLTSGYANDRGLLDTLTLGARGFIKKPFSMAQLAEKVREVLDS